MLNSCWLAAVLASLDGHDALADGVRWLCPGTFVSLVAPRVPPLENSSLMNGSTGMSAQTRESPKIVVSFWYPYGLALLAAVGLLLLAHDPTDLPRHQCAFLAPTSVSPRSFVVCLVAPGFYLVQVMSICHVLESLMTPSLPCRQYFCPAPEAKDYPQSFCLCRFWMTPVLCCQLQSGSLSYWPHLPHFCGRYDHLTQCEAQGR